MPPNSNCPIKVSVIVPVYNVEKYLRTCMDFIVAQTLKEIEIICVNDGSTDGSLAILEEYALDDSRIKIVTQENKGLSGARNTGMDLAKGEYITFIDSDDWFYTLTALEELYGQAKKFSLDVLRHRLVCFDNVKGNFSHRPWDNYAKFLPKGFYTEAFPPEACKPFFWRIPVTAPGAIYFRKFIDQNKIRFAEGLTFEDQLFFRQCLILARRVGFIDKAFVVYRKNRTGSITDNWDGNWKDYIVIHRLLFEFVSRRLKDARLVETLRKDIVEIFSGAYATRSNVEWKEEMRSGVRESFLSIVPKNLLGNMNFMAMLSSRAKLFLEWIYSGEGYAEFWRKREGIFRRYRILRHLTFGKRRQVYKAKLASRF